MLSLLNEKLLSRRIPLMVSLGLGAAMLVHLAWALRTPVPSALPRDEMDLASPPDFLALALDAPLLDSLESIPIPVVSQTALQARLQGVSTGLGPALAIIDHAGRSRVVMEQDALEDGVRVHRILPDRVLLQHGNRLETLALHRQSTIPNANARPAYADDTEVQNDGEMQQWLQTLSEADPETAAWLREQLKELHEREPND